VALPVKEGTTSGGDLLVQIKPDNYQATRDYFRGQYQSSLRTKTWRRARWIRRKPNTNAISNCSSTGWFGFVFLDVKTTYEVANCSLRRRRTTVDQAKYGLDNANADLKKTTILSPIDGTCAVEIAIGDSACWARHSIWALEIMTVAEPE